tara:strand:+ start:62 stop:628 length:567 start_codon:yes stop_codon:yes gene_type:complete
MPKRSEPEYRVIATPMYSELEVAIANFDIKKVHFSFLCHHMINSLYLRLIKVRELLAVPWENVKRRRMQNKGSRLQPLFFALRECIREPYSSNYDWKDRLPLVEEMLSILVRHTARFTDLFTLADGELHEKHIFDFLVHCEFKFCHSKSDLVPKTRLLDVLVKQIEWPRDCLDIWVSLMRSTDPFAPD